MAERLPSPLELERCNRSERRDADPLSVPLRSGARQSPRARPSEKCIEVEKVELLVRARAMEELLHRVLADLAALPAAANPFRLAVRERDLARARPLAFQSIRQLACP